MVKPAILLGGLAIFTGCNTHVVKVDAMARPDAEQSIAYVIRTSNPELDPDSLRFKEAERHVKTALSGKGLYEAPKRELADMVVSIDYGISPPVVSIEHRSEPIYRQVPGETRSEQVQVGTDSKGNPIYSTIRVQDPPTIKYVGNREYSVTVITYEKYLRLSARKNANQVEGLPEGEVWTVDVSTNGENRDLRKALPVLAAATIEFVGQETHGQKTIKLKDNDKDGAVAFVKKGL